MIWSPGKKKKRWKLCPHDYFDKRNHCCEDRMRAAWLSQFTCEDDGGVGRQKLNRSRSDCVFDKGTHTDLVASIKTWFAWPSPEIAVAGIGQTPRWAHIQAAPAHHLVESTERGGSQEASIREGAALGLDRRPGVGTRQPHYVEAGWGPFGKFQVPEYSWGGSEHFMLNRRELSSKDSQSDWQPSREVFIITRGGGWPWMEPVAEWEEITC